MIKTLALGCLLAVSTAFAGTAPSSKAVSLPPPAVACPGGIAYNTVELDWVRIFPDEGDTVDGANLELSYSPFAHFYVLGTASVVDDNWGYTAGAGYALTIANNVDFVLEAGGLFDNDDDIVYVRPHLRAKFGCLELHAGAKLYCYDDEQWGGFASAYYEVCPNVDLGVTGIFTSDASALQVGVRYKF
jgi:hypothetical protein